MAIFGPVVIIEDDIDDKEILEEILRELNFMNKIVWLKNSHDAFDYLHNTSDEPFVIFSDINLPGLSGIQLKKKIDEDKEMRKKSIPFIFYSTSVSQQTVKEAYTEMTVQGFFQKGSNYAEIKKQVAIILQYWQTCRHPNY